MELEMGDREFVETRVRNIPADVWEAFKKHCENESKKRKKYISANTRLVEMIHFVVASDPNL